MDVVQRNLKQRERSESRRIPIRRRIADWYYTRRLLGNMHGNSVLELGPGFNSYHKQLQKRFKTLWGIDLNPEACQRNERLGYNMIKDVIGELDKFFIPDTFDCVFSRHCLEHLDKPLKTLNSIPKILKKGGWSLHEVPIPPYYEPAHIAEYYPHEWAVAIQLSGLTVYEAEIVNFLGIKYLHLKARKGSHIEDGFGDKKWWELMDLRGKKP